MDIEALKKLRMPFPANAISKLPKPTRRDNPKGACKVCGGYHGLPAVHLDYVGHAALTDRLLDTDPGWNWEPLALTSEGLPLFDASGGLWIKLSVGGMTRLGYGHALEKDYAEPGMREKEVIGDALRNAAMRFGAALDLWHKGDLHVEEPDKEAQDKELDGLHAERARLAEEETEQARANEAKTLDAVYAKIAATNNLPHLYNYEIVLRGTTKAKNAVGHEHYNLLSKLNADDKKALEDRIKARREHLKDNLPKGVDTTAMLELAAKKAVTKEAIKASLKEHYYHDDLTRITADEMDAIMTWLGGMPDMAF